jgi:hypothetical protein
MKIVVNRCFGGFGLSEAAYKELNIPWDGYGFAFRGDEERCDPALVACVAKLGKAANGRCAKLCVVEVPDDVEWQIEDYDGSEHVAEKHRTW